MGLKNLIFARENFAPKYPNFISPSSKSYFIRRESKEIYQVMVLTTEKELSRGFSGVKPEQVEDFQGLLFAFPDTSLRYFWMPNTFFNLKIIYLDENFVVKNIVENAPHHIGYDESVKKIFRAPAYSAKYVLEFKSSSKKAAEIKIGDKFSWVREGPTFQRK